MLSVFKDIDQKELLPKKRHNLGCFLEKCHEKNFLWKNTKFKKTIKKILKDISKTSDTLFTTLPQILMDLTRYSSDEILFKVIEILDKISSDNTKLFEVVGECQVINIF